MFDRQGHHLSCRCSFAAWALRSNAPVALTSYWNHLFLKYQKQPVLLSLKILSSNQEEYLSFWPAHRTRSLQGILMPYIPLDCLLFLEAVLRFGDQCAVQQPENQSSFLTFDSQKMPDPDSVFSSYLKNIFYCSLKRVLS